jgi:hypothetical protein
MNSAATGFDVDKFGEWLTEVTGEAAELSVTPCVEAAAAKCSVSTGSAKPGWCAARR